MSLPTIFNDQKISLYLNYLIVEFEDKRVQCIPKIWFFQNDEGYKCKLPRPSIDVHTEKQYNRAVKNMTIPSDTWPVWSIAKICGSSDSYERAYEKLSNVIQFNYSECDTEVEALAKSQRQIRAKKTKNSPNHDVFLSPKVRKVTKSNSCVIYPNVPSPNMFEDNCLASSIVDVVKIKNTLPEETEISSLKNDDKLFETRYSQKYLNAIQTSSTKHSLFSDESPSPVKKKKKIVQGNAGCISNSTKSVTCKLFSDKSPSPLNKKKKTIQGDARSTIISSKPVTRRLFSDESPSPINKKDRLAHENTSIKSPLKYTAYDDLISDESPSLVNKKRQNTFKNANIVVRSTKYTGFNSTFDKSPSLINKKVQITGNEYKTNSSKQVSHQSSIFNESPSPKHKSTLSDLKKTQFGLMMKTILELKAQNAIIISNQERIFNKLAMNDGVNSFDKTLEKEYSIQYKKFPLKDNDDLDSIENLLKDESFCQYMSNIISMYGGSDIGTYVKTCLENVFSNSVGTNITITGKINKCFGNAPKISMKTLRLFNVICECGRNKFPSTYNDDTVIKTTSSWLRHSKERLKRKQTDCNKI